MRRATVIHLNEDERRYVQIFVRRAKANRRTITRARVLLKCDEGWTIGELTEAFGVSDTTIRTVQQRYLTGGVEAVLADKQQARRLQALTDEQAACLIAIARSEVPDGHNHWTMRMLADKAVELGYVRKLSQETVRNLLKKTR